MLPIFMETITKFTVDKKEFENMKSKAEKNPDKAKREIRKLSSVKLVTQLQHLFAYLINSNRKCVDTKAVTSAIVDDYGKPIKIGEQKDVGEFNINFLTRLNEALELGESSILQEQNLDPIAKRELDRSVALGMSVLLPISAEQLQKCFIYNTFFGTFGIFTKALDKDGKIVESVTNTTFGQIIIDANSSNIYDGWEKNYYTEVEDFQTPTGFVTKAEQQYWITKRPTVLFMQIQRLTYDRALKKPKKLNNPVSFDKTIYLDRFMIENRSLMELGKGGIEKYKEKIKKLKEGIKLYTSYGEEKLDLRKSLKTTLEFLKSQDKDEMTLVDIYEGSDIVYDPIGIGVNGNPKNTILTLEHSLSQINQQVEIMEKTLAEYEEQVAKYDGMKKYPYDLHAILMHNGGPEGGHYYAFIYDSGKKKWRKYNDEDVTEISEENVFKEAIGDGKSPASAYFLIYASRELDETGKLGKSTIPDFALSASKLIHAGSREIINYYSSLLPAALKREVFEDNLRLDVDIMEKKAGWICQKAIEIYPARFNKLMQNKKLKGYPEWNFISYLEDSNYPYYKYVLLNTIISELNDGAITLDILEDYDPIIKTLNEKFLKQVQNAPQELKIPDSEISNIDQKYISYSKLIIDKKMQHYILTKLLAKDWPAGLDGIECYLGANLYSDSANKKIVEDIMRLISLKFMSLVNMALMNKNLPQALCFLRYISQRIAPFLDNDDPHVTHPKRYLTEVFKEIYSYIKPEEIKEIDTELKLFTTNKKQLETKKPNSVYF